MSDRWAQCIKGAPGWHSIHHTALSAAAGDGQQQKGRHRLLLQEGDDNTVGCNAQSAAVQIGEPECSSKIDRHSDRAIAGDRTIIKEWRFVQPGERIETSLNELND